ncbi:MAG: putative cytokinetic ring protein SteA [Marmoricola sp.]
MRLRNRSVPPSTTGTTLTVRSHRDPATLLERAEPGDLLVIDHRDLDAETARRLVDARPYAVLNASEFISGRFANLGPRLLAGAGIRILEGDRDLVLGLRDGGSFRLEGTTLYDGPVVALDVREVSADQVVERMEAARSGLAAQLESFAHTASEFLRREEDLLLHGTGSPTLAAATAGRVCVVVTPTAQVADVKRLRRFIREQRAVVFAVDSGAESVVSCGLRPDVLVMSRAGTVQPKALARSREVVVNDTSTAARRRAEKLNLPVHTISTSAASVDIALLLAQRGDARLVIPIGTPASLDDFIDRDRSDQASSVLTRLRLGNVLIEGAAVPLLYTGRVRRWQLALVLLAAAAVLAVAVAATPVGHDWAHDLRNHLPFGLDR